MQSQSVEVCTPNKKCKVEYIPNININNEEFDAQFFATSIIAWRKNKIKYYRSALSDVVRSKFDCASVINKTTRKTYYKTDTDSPFTLEELIGGRSRKTNIYNNDWMQCGYINIDGNKCTHQCIINDDILLQNDYDHEKYTQVYYCLIHKKYEKAEQKTRITHLKLLTMKYTQ